MIDSPPPWLSATEISKTADFHRSRGRWLAKWRPLGPRWGRGMVWWSSKSFKKLTLKARQWMSWCHENSTIFRYEVGRRDIMKIFHHKITSRHLISILVVWTAQLTPGSWKFRFGNLSDEKNEFLEFNQDPCFGIYWCWNRSRDFFFWAAKWCGLSEVPSIEI